MPLIVIVGGPCCGKTTTAVKIKDFLEKEKDKKVILINEETLGVNKLDFYKDSTSEKIIRAKLKSNVEKNLDDKSIVIIDSMNYIKGYRYELYCLVRTFQTRHCIVYIPVINQVYCKAELDVCLKLNNNNVYPEDLLKDLYSRMEEPNPNSKEIDYIRQMGQPDGVNQLWRGNKFRSNLQQFSRREKAARSSIDKERQHI